MLLLVRHWGRESADSIATLRHISSDAQARTECRVDYEKNYLNLTFVISALGYFDTGLPLLSSSRFASWPIPSLAQAKGTYAETSRHRWLYPAPHATYTDIREMAHISTGSACG